MSASGGPLCHRERAAAAPDPPGALLFSWRVSVVCALSVGAEAGMAGKGKLGPGYSFCISSFSNQTMALKRKHFL